MSTGRFSNLRIETPEGVAFSFRLATPVVRSLAWLLDAVIVVALVSVLTKVVGGIVILSADWMQALGTALYFAVSVAYGIVLEWYWRGQTIGKRLLHLRVVDAQGLRLQWTQVALRNLLRAIDLLPGAYLVGGAACLFSRYGQRLGDLAANTVVLRESARLEVDLEEIAPAKYNSLAASPNLAARLRSRVDPEAVGIATAALALRDSYEPAARVQLFGELAAYFRTLAEFPEQLVDGLTDEQYIRSAIRVICEAGGERERRIAG